MYNLDIITNTSVFAVTLLDEFKTESKCKYCWSIIYWWLTRKKKKIPISRTYIEEIHEYEYFCHYNYCSRFNN